MYMHRKSAVRSSLLTLLRALRSPGIQGSWTRCEDISEIQTHQPMLSLICPDILSIRVMGLPCTTGCLVCSHYDPLFSGLTSWLLFLQNSGFDSPLRASQTFYACSTSEGERSGKAQGVESKSRYLGKNHICHKMITLHILPCWWLMLCVDLTGHGGPDIWPKSGCMSMCRGHSWVGSTAESVDKIKHTVLF